jgi:hypothetical protein
MGAVRLGLFLALLPSQDGEAERRVVQLHSDLPEERDAATLALERLGAKALAALREGLLSGDPEVAARCRDLLERLTRERIRVPAGNFEIEFEGGSVAADSPGLVRLARRPATWGQIRAWINAAKKGSGPLKGPLWVYEYLDGGSFRGDDDPDVRAGYLHWHGAIEFCDWLSRETGLYFRPPTEREWKPPGLPGAPDEPLEYSIDPFEGEAGPPALLAPGMRSGLDPLWYESDPCRPRHLYWLSDGKRVGLRVALVSGACPREEREAYAKRIEIRVTGVKPLSDRESVRALGNHHLRIDGEIENRGMRLIEELELAVVHRSGRDEVCWADLSENPRPLYNKTWPVLPAGASRGDHARPLPPGGRRSFTILVPERFDDDGEEPRRFATIVTALRLGKE